MKRAQVSAKVAIYGLGLGILPLLGSVALGDPVAIVEDIKIVSTTLEIMDYVEPGDVVRLRPGERLVLGYFASCLQEAITGGTVIVGRRKSVVDGGNVSRQEVECDSKPVTLTENQSNESGVVAFRRGGTKTTNKARPQFTLHGLHPIVRSDLPGELMVTRIDKSASVIKLSIVAGANDFSARQIALAPGAIYQATLTTQEGPRSLVFKTDAFAQSGDGPVLSRLIRF